MKTKSKNSSCDKTRNLNCEKTEIATELKAQAEKKKNIFFHL